MTELNFKNKTTGKRAKITVFSKDYPERKGVEGRYFVALFEKDQLTSTNGWFTNVKRHAVGDARAFVKGE